MPYNEVTYALYKHNKWSQWYSCSSIKHELLLCMCSRLVPGYFVLAMVDTYLAAPGLGNCVIAVWGLGLVEAGVAGKLPVQLRFGTTWSLCNVLSITSLILSHCPFTATERPQQSPAQQPFQLSFPMITATCHIAPAPGLPDLGAASALPPTRAYAFAIADPPYPRQYSPPIARIVTSRPATRAVTLLSPD
jgi:hypothetical protein